MKKTFCEAVLIAALAHVPLFAQNQAATFGESVHASGMAADISQDWKVKTPSIPVYCKPCYFYSGNVDCNNKNADGLANENDHLVADSRVYVPFRVTKNDQCGRTFHQQP